MQIHDSKTYNKLKGRGQTNFPNKIVLHHNGGSDKFPLADTSHHTFEQIERDHLSKGWEGVGYHYVVVLKTGKIYRGRPEKIHGAHTRGQNKSSIGIMVVGNFDVTLPTEEQESSLRWLLRDVGARWGITPDNVFPHRKFASKTCFGNRLPDSWGHDIMQTDQCVCLLHATKQELVKELLSRLSK